MGFAPWMFGSVERQNDFADVAVGFGEVMSRGDFGERERPLDRDPDRTRRQMWQQVARTGLDAVERLFARARTERHAYQLQSEEGEAIHVEFADPPTHAADIHQ